MTSSMNPWLLSAFGALVAVYAGLLFLAFSTTRQVERSVPPQGSFLEVNGVRLHYVERGSGPITLLLIHGLGGNARHFTCRVLDALARDHHVIAIDRPGSGYSGRMVGETSPQAHAEMIAAFIAARQLEQPVVVGHSLGGTVALALAVAHPTRVRALALVAPLTQVPPAVPAVFAGLVIPNALVRAVIGWTLAVPVSMSRRDEVLGTVFGPEPVPADFGTAGGGLLGVRPSSFISASADLVAVPPNLPALIARYPELRMPIAVLYGMSDRVLSPELHGTEFTRQVSHATLEPVAGAGHMLPITAPERVTAFIHAVATRVGGIAIAPPAPIINATTGSD